MGKGKFCLFFHFAESLYFVPEGTLRTMLVFSNSCTTNLPVMYTGCEVQELRFPILMSTFRRYKISNTVLGLFS